MAKKINYKSLLAKEQKELIALIKRMPKFTTRSNVNQSNKLDNWIIIHKSMITRHLNNLSKYAHYVYLDSAGQYDLIEKYDTNRSGLTTLSGRGWHKDHYNYNKAEKWELPPSLRRTPARNVTKAGTKRKRKTNIKKYK